ncbi:MAG: ABC transporter ATP-binding protein, partial [Leucobacter sp.]
LQRTTGVTFVFVTHDQEEALSMGDRIAVFNQGRLEQIGTPEEIYEKPASRFVADFIGETNFLETPVERRAGATVDELVVTLPGGNPVTLHKVVPTPGGTVTLTIRPERIHLTPSGEHVATGEITKLVYMGTDLRCTVTLADGTELAVRVPPPFDEGFRPGAEVKLYADAASLRPLTSETHE